jgi:hypothetical protein
VSVLLSISRRLFGNSLIGEAKAPYLLPGVDLGRGE